MDITTQRCHGLKEQLKVWNGNTISLDHFFRFAPWTRVQANGDGEAKSSSNRSPRPICFSHRLSDKPEQRPLHALDGPPF